MSECLWDLKAHEFRAQWIPEWEDWEFICEKCGQTRAESDRKAGGTE